jgi:hypothetical protein
MNVNIIRVHKPMHLSPGDHVIPLGGDKIMVVRKGEPIPTSYRDDNASSLVQASAQPVPPLQQVLPLRRGTQVEPARLKKASPINAEDAARVQHEIITAMVELNAFKESDIWVSTGEVLEKLGLTNEPLAIRERYRWQVERLVVDRKVLRRYEGRGRNSCKHTLEDLP